MKSRIWGAFLAATFVCGAEGSADAGGFNLFIGGGGPVYAPPVVYAPAPVVYAPPPVVYAPPPQPYFNVGFYGGRFGGHHHHHGYHGGWGGHHHHHHHHGHW